MTNSLGINVNYKADVLHLIDDVLHLIDDDKAMNHINKLQKRMSKTKALSVLTHKIGRFMLKNKTIFDEERFLKN